jgi:ankyrin repeat protein
VASLWNEYEVAKFLAAGSDATIRTKSGRTSLHLACRARKSGIVGLLLSKFEKDLLDTPDSFGRTPLHDACTSGRLESVYYLLRAGANVISKDVKGRTPLHSCAEFSMEQKLWFLQKHPNAPSGHDAKDRFRPTSVWPDWEGLWYTSKYDRRPPFTEDDTARIGIIVKCLLAAGADINAEDLSKRTPLDLSLVYQCDEMAKALRSADPKPRQLDSANPQLQLELLLKQSSPSNFGALSDEIRRKVLEKPSDYLDQLQQADIEWIIDNIASNDQSGYVLGFILRAAAEKGLVEIVESVGTRAALYDKQCSAPVTEEASQVAKPEPNWEPILYTACGRELPNLQVLEMLVAKCGLNVNAQAIKAKENQEYPPGAISSTSLHRLAKGKHWWHLDAIQFLVKSGADVNSKNTDGETPLHIASNFKKDTGMGTLLSDEEVGFWKPQCVEVLLELGADPNILDTDGRSPLHKAAACPIIMQKLLSQGADISAGTVSPIFSAIQAQNLQALSILLQAGGDPNIIDTNATFHINYTVDPDMTKREVLRSALFCASFPGLHNQNIQKTAPLVKLLIQSGADMYAPLNEQDSLLHYVFHHAEYEMVCSFLECAKMINFDSRDQSGRTVLLAACNWEKTLPGYRYKHWDPKASGPLIRILDFELDVMAVSNDGRNILHHLMDNPDIEQDTVLQFLDREPEKCKLLIKQRDNEGFTPIHSALRVLRPEVCEKFLELGAQILEPDPTGATVLHRIAAQYLNKNRLSRSHHLAQENLPEYYSSALRIFRKYLSLGGSINARDNTGSPPLFPYLSSKFYYKTGTHVEKFADLFPDNSAVDFQATNNEGETALHIISKVGGKEIFEFMVKKGLDPLQEDANGRTALDVAAACEMKEILDLFQYGS